MPEHPHFSDEEIVNPETHHEESDVDVRGLLMFVVVFIVFAAVMHVALWLLFKFYVEIGKGQQTPSMTQIASSPNAGVPAEPRLQPFPAKGPQGQPQSPVSATPVADLENMRAHEQQVLTQYGWVDQQKGIVHIPIDQAKQLALQRGFPVNTTTAAPVATPATTSAAPAQTRPTAGAPASPPAIPTKGGPNAARVGSTATTGTPKP